MGNYILDGKNPVKCDDLIEWAMWFEKANRHVSVTNLPDDVRVSTVFLGLDHSFGFGSGKPILFETMIFGGEQDGFCERYETWDEAEVGHQKAIELVFA